MLACAMLSHAEECDHSSLLPFMVYEGRCRGHSVGNNMYQKHFI